MLNKIRLKLTLINSAVVFTVIAAITIFVYVSVSYNVTSNTDEELVSYTYQLKRYIPIAESKTVGPDLTEEYDTFNEKLKNASIMYGVWDAHSNELSVMSHFEYPQNALADIRRLIFSSDIRAAKTVALADSIYYIHIYNFEDTHLRICTSVIANDSGQMRILQTVGNMNSISSYTAKLLNTLILAGAFGVSLAFASGYILSGRSIIPIQQSMNSQKEFIADASHELKTPITIVRTNLDVVKAYEEETVVSQMHWINNAYGETERMERLIKDLLLLAKADLNQENLAFEKCELGEICLDEAQRFAQIAQDKKIEIQFEKPAEKYYIHADKSKISQMIGILIDNAIIYSSAGTKVTLSLAQNRFYAQIDVTDEGIGIEKDDLEKIFTRFYRADKARSRRAGGTGLGLAIARWIAEQHKGEIYASSVKNKGTTMSVNLPISESDTPNGLSRSTE